MARAARARRGGPGYAGLIIFIVLCMGLIAGYVWLVPEYTFALSEMAQINSDIKAHVEGRVGAELKARAKSTSKRSERAYHSEFFQKVGESAADGLRYNTLVQVGGWEGENPVQDIQDFLKAGTDFEQKDTLRAYIRELDSLLKRKEEALREEARKTVQAETSRDEYKQLMTTADRRAAAAERQKNDELRKKEQSLQAERVKYIRQADEMSKQAAGTRKELDSVMKKQRQEVAVLNKQITGLKDRIRELDAELAKKKPKPVKVTEGRVLQVDQVGKVAVINLGKREGIGVGERFIVMDIGPGGERIPKAEIQVTRVMDIISRADIISRVPESEMVVPQDIVRRVKQVND